MKTFEIQTLPLDSLRMAFVPDKRSGHPETATDRACYERRLARLEGIRQHIAEHGMVNPLIIWRQNDELKVWVGNQRYWALKRLGVTEAPCIVVDTYDDVKLAQATYENVDGF